MSVMGAMTGRSIYGQDTGGGGTFPTPSQIAAAVRVEMDTNSTRLDAAVSTRAPADTALSSSVWTAEKAGYVDATISSRAVPGDAMTLTEAADNSIASAVWRYASRTLTSMGAIASQIWSYPRRTLTNQDDKRGDSAYRNR